MSKNDRRKLRSDQFLGGYHLGERMQAIRNCRKEKMKEEEQYKVSKNDSKEKSQNWFFSKKFWWKK